MKCLKKLLLSFLLLLICMFFIHPLNKTFASSDDTISFTAISSFSNDKEREYKDIKLPSAVVGKYFVIDIDSNNYVDCFYSDNQIIMSKDGFLYSPGLKRFNCFLSDFINNAGWGTARANGDYSYCNYIDLSGRNGQPAKFFTASNTILNADGTIFFEKAPTYKNPYIVNSLDSLATWKFDNLWVDYGDYDINKTIYLHICKKTVDVSGASSFYYTDSVIALSANGKYYESYEDGQVYYFSIPKDNLPFTVSSGDKIIFYLSANANNLGGAYSSDEPLKNSNIFDTKSFTVGSSYTDEDKQKDYQDKISSSLEDQKQAIEENTKTNKNIFEKIGDILSYINPFSDNFFGKKLVELILDGLKGLFVPEDGFFDTYFSDLKNWFSDRLGFLWTPFDIIIDILNKILNINFSDPIFHIPEINEPFTGSKLISEYDYNLNDLLDNEVFKNIHNIYFIGVDAVIIFVLINLARRKIEEVFSN